MESQYQTTKAPLAPEFYSTAEVQRANVNALMGSTLPDPIPISSSTDPMLVSPGTSRQVVASDTPYVTNGSSLVPTATEGSYSSSLADPRLASSSSSAGMNTGSIAARGVSSSGPYVSTSTGMQNMSSRTATVDPYVSSNTTTAPLEVAGVATTTYTTPVILTGTRHTLPLGTYVPFPAVRIPYPLPPIDDLTPAERAVIKDEAKADLLRIKEAEIEHKKSTGIVGKITGGIQEITLAAKLAMKPSHRGPGNQRLVVSRAAHKRFTTTFPHLSSDYIHGDYACVLYNHALVPPEFPGIMTVTDHNVCFSNAPDVNFFIPLEDIVSLQLAVSLSMETKLVTPKIVQINEPNVIPNVLQIYTIQGQVHNAGHILDIKEAFTVLDHAVRAVSNLPMPGVSYNVEMVTPN